MTDINTTTTAPTVAVAETTLGTATKGGESVQTPDSPGNDENGDGLTGGQETADNFGDILGV